MHIGQVLFLEGGAVSSAEVESVLEDLDCVVHLTSNVRGASKILQRQSIDLVILNVEGEADLAIIDFALSLKKFNLPIIFLALNNNRESYDMAQQANMIAYIVSPFDMLTLRSVVTHSLNLNHNQERNISEKWPNNRFMNDALFIKVNQSLQKVIIENITHVRSEGNYCLIFTTEKKYAIKLSMVRLNQNLAEKGFIQVHKSYLAKLNKIDNIDISGNEVIIGDVRIPLGRKYKQELLAHLNLL